MLSKVSSSCLQHYGEVPEYLRQRKEEEQRAQQEYDNFVKEQREQRAMKHLSDKEKQTALEVLKHMALQMTILSLKQQGIIQTLGTT